MTRRALHTLSALCAFAVAATARAGLDVEFPDVSPTAGVRIQLQSAFDTVAHAGFVPLRITLRNDATETRSWSFDFSSATSYREKDVISSQLTLDVPAQSEKTVEQLVPVAPQLTEYSHPTVTIRCSGPGVNSRFVWSGGSYGYTGSSYTPAMALSDSLATPLWSELESRMKKAGRTLRAARFNPALLPADPMAWIGWDFVWLADHEWAAAGAAQRRALTDWVKLGGRLILATAGATPAAAPDLPPAPSIDLGAGHVDRIAYPAGGAALLDRVNETVSDVNSLVNTIGASYKARWLLRDTIPDVRVRSGPIMLFVIVFAVLIGPVNLVVLARRRRHMHLFWTTPALALVASLALGLVIVLQDGFGGRGVRFTLVYLDPDAHQACIWQEQISRTGVLLGRTFPRADGSFLVDLPLNSYQNNEAPAGRLTGRTWSGDWFASRRVQAQLLCSLQPTRARVRIDATDPAAPTVLSELATPLNHLFYTDAQGVTWRAGPIEPGARVALTRCPEADLKMWRSATLGIGGPRIQQVLPPDARRDWFLAEAASPTEHVLPTLASIRWTQRALIYHGPAAREGAP